MSDKLTCPKCGSNAINQFRMERGVIWCADCGLRSEHKETYNPFKMSSPRLYANNEKDFIFIWGGKPYRVKEIEEKHWLCYYTKNKQWATKKVLAQKEMLFFYSKKLSYEEGALYFKNTNNDVEKIKQLYRSQIKENT